MPKDRTSRLMIGALAGSMPMVWRTRLWTGRYAEDAEFEASMRRLMDEVTEHIEDEEHNLFPQLAKDATRDELVELGEKVRVAKAVAPTRPHPAAPDRPPLNKLLAPGAGLIDRVRDRLSGRGGH